VGKTTAPNIDTVLSNLRAELRRRAEATGFQVLAVRDRATLESQGNPGIFVPDEWQEQLVLANALASQGDADQYMRQRTGWTASGFGEADFNPAPRVGADDIAVALLRLGRYWMLECNFGALRSVLDAAREAIGPIRELNQAVCEAGAPKVASLLTQRVRCEDPENGAGLIIERVTAAQEAIEEVDRIFSQFLTDGSPWDDLLGASKIAAGSDTPFWTRPRAIRQAQALIRTREILLPRLDDKSIARLTDDGGSGSLSEHTRRVAALRSDLKRLS